MPSRYDDWNSPIAPRTPVSRSPPQRKASTRKVVHKYVPSEGSSISAFTEDESAPSPYNMPIHRVPWRNRAVQRMSRFFMPQSALAPISHWVDKGPRQQADNVPAPLRGAIIRTTFAKGFTVLLCSVSATLLLAAFAFNDVMKVDLPAYAQDGETHSATSIQIQFRMEINAIPGSQWSTWSGQPFTLFIMGYMSLMGAIACLIAAVCQAYGTALRKELPNSVQASLSGACDRLYPEENFHKYGCGSSKLWFLIPFSLLPLANLIISLLIVTTTSSHLGSVNAIGQASSTRLGLSTVFSIIASLTMLLACCLAPYEQVCKAKQRDLELEFASVSPHPVSHKQGINDSSIPFDAPPAYSSPLPSAFVPKSSFTSPHIVGYLRSPPRTHRTPRTPRLPRPRSEISDATTVVVPRQQQAFSDWGQPLQKR